MYVGAAAQTRRQCAHGQHAGASSRTQSTTHAPSSSVLTAWITVSVFECWLRLAVLALPLDHAVITQNDLTCRLCRRYS